jgi:hypothetical protein
MEGTGRGFIRSSSIAFSEGLRKTKKTFGQESRSPGRDSNPEPPNTKQECYALCRDVWSVFS